MIELRARSLAHTNGRVKFVSGKILREERVGSQEVSSAVAATNARESETASGQELGGDECT